MSHEVFNLKQAAEHVHMEPNDLRHVAQRGEVEATERGGEWYFEHRALDEWAQRNILAANARELAAQHRVLLEVLERVLAGRVVHDGRHVQLVENLHHRVEQLVVQELVAVRACQLHADHAELLDAALDLGDVLQLLAGKQFEVYEHLVIAGTAAVYLLAHVA